MADITDNDSVYTAVLCCPQCRHALDIRGVLARCHSCGWSSSTARNDTLALTDRIYDAAQLRTHRRSMDNDPSTQPEGLLAKLVAWGKAFPPYVAWRDFVMGTASYWEKGTRAFRVEEMKRVRRLFDRMGVPTADLLLELGVGSQDRREFYRHVANRVICSDIYRDPLAAQYYHGPSSQALYCIINAENLPLRTSSVDTVFTSHVVEHFPDRRHTLRDLHRILKPGGWACHVVPLAAGFALRHLLRLPIHILRLNPRIRFEIHGEYNTAWQEVRDTTIYSWRRLFTSCGFRIVAESPGTMAVRPFRHYHTIPLGNILGFATSHIFLMRAEST